MNKKRIFKWAIIIATALVLVMLMIPQREKRRGSFSELTVSQDAAQQIMSGKTYRENMAPDIYFDGEKLFYDEKDKCYYYSVIDGSATGYDPEVSIESSIKDTKIAIIESAIKDELIASNMKVKLLIYDVTGYSEADLACTTLPVVSIDTQEEIGDLDIPMNVRVFDNRKVSEKRNTTSEGTVRLRGNTTRIFPKKSFKLNLNEGEGTGKRNIYTSFLGMRADNDWVLTACYNDRDKVRNLFSHNLWTYSCGTDNAYGLQTGIEFRFVELFVNGQYWGLYTLGYKPDTKTLGENIKDKDYFYKVDYLLSGFRSDVDIDPINEYYTLLENNAADNEYLKRSVDMDNAIDFNLFVTLIQGSDNILKNYYVLLTGNDSEKKAIYVPWDLDRSWGDEFSAAEKNQTAYYKLAPYENMIFTDNGLYQLLFNEDDETWDLLFEKYDRLRSSGWSDEAVLKLLDEYDSDIFGSGAYLREKERWPEADYNEENNLDTFRNFVSERFSQMDELIDRLKNYRSGNPFIDQSICNVRFEDSTMVVEINDRWILEDGRYRELLEYIGIDTSLIDDETRYVITDFGGKNISYLADPRSYEDGPDTDVGLLRIEESELENYEYDEDYTVFLGDTKCFNSSDETADPIIVAAICDDRAVKLNMDDGYRVQYDMYDAPQDPQFILDLLDNLGGYILLQVNNTKADYVQNSRFLKAFSIDFGSFASLEDAMAGSNELVFLLDSDRRTGYFLSDPYVSGSAHDTAIGQYAFFGSDTDYGIYINGNEAQTGSIEGLSDKDLIVTVFTKEYQETSKYGF